MASLEDQFAEIFNNEALSYEQKDMIGQLYVITLHYGKKIPESQFEETFKIFLKMASRNKIFEFMSALEFKFRELNLI